jgi:hypothetical protein
MARSLASAALIAALLAAAPAAAKDVCVQDAFTNYLVFPRAKPPKKPGRTALLQGLYVREGVSFPLSGSALVRADGSVVFGVTVHAVATGADFVYAMTMVGDASFAASGYYDTDGDGGIDASQAWSPVDCGSLTLP